MDENKKAAQKKKISHFITMAVLVILFLAFIFPFIMVIFNAFKTKGDITADPLALVGSHGFILTNFTDAMKKMNFATSFTNSLLITTVSTILTIMLSAMTAFVIVRNKWKACGILFSLMIASMVIPFQVLMIPLVSLYGGIFGVLNSRITLILMHVGFSLSMATFMFHGEIHTSVPMALEEAAFIDGCGYFKTMIKVMAPMAKPSIITVILFNFLAFWNEYIIALTLMPGASKTLPVGLVTLSKGQMAAANYGQLYAGLVIVMLPTLILYIMVQKKLTQGMTLGGLKD